MLWFSSYLTSSLMRRPSPLSSTVTSCALGAGRRGASLQGNSIQGCPDKSFRMKSWCTPGQGQGRQVAGLNEMGAYARSRYILNAKRTLHGYRRDGGKRSTGLMELTSKPKICYLGEQRSPDSCRIDPVPVLEKWLHRVKHAPDVRLRCTLTRVVPEHMSF